MSDYYEMKIGDLEKTIKELEQRNEKLARMLGEIASCEYCLIENEYQCEECFCMDNYKLDRELLK